MSERISATRILCKVAAMAGGGLPCPDGVRIYDDHRPQVRLTFPDGDIHALNTWARAITEISGGKFHRREQPYTPKVGPRAGQVCTLIDDDGPFVDGWSINLHVATPPHTVPEEIPADDPDLAVVLAQADGQVAG